MKGRKMKKLLLWVSMMVVAGLSVMGAEHAVWYTDASQALAKAKETKLPILLVISGSDWCPPCMALEKNVLGNKKFQKFAEGKLILLQADFPRRKKQSEAVAKQAKAIKAKYAPNDGFPTVMVISPDDKVLGKQVGYSSQMDAEKYINLLKGLMKK